MKRARLQKCVRTQFRKPPSPLYTFRTLLATPPPPGVCTSFMDAPFLEKKNSKNMDFLFIFILDLRMFHYFVHQFYFLYFVLSEGFFSVLLQYFFLKLGLD